MCYSAVDSACHIQRVDILPHCNLRSHKNANVCFPNIHKYPNKFTMNFKYYVCISHTHIPNLKRANLAIWFLLQLMAFMVHGIPNAPSPSLFQYSTLIALLLNILSTQFSIALSSFPLCEMFMVHTTVQKCSSDED